MTLQFGPNLPPSVKVDQVLTEELKDRVNKLLTGKYKVDAEGRCILDPIGDFGDFGAGGLQPRDSVCIGVDLGPISIGYCKDV
jgi:hypothetical protein